jgi:hypothetical protein
MNSAAQSRQASPLAAVVAIGLTRLVVVLCSVFGVAQPTLRMQISEFREKFVGIETVVSGTTAPPSHDEDGEPQKSEDSSRPQRRRDECVQSWCHATAGPSQQVLVNRADLPDRYIMRELAIFVQKDRILWSAAFGRIAGRPAVATTDHPRLRQFPAATDPPAGNPIRKKADFAVGETLRT